VTLGQKTAGTPITIAVAPPGDVLGLLPSDLENITAGTLIIGNASSGLFSVSDPYSAASATNLQLASGYVAGNRRQLVAAGEEATLKETAKFDASRSCR
jgi:hypothetical protein